ncbi:MAG TPA: hypothetical protein VJQ25_02970 [Nitrospira sp.]|nr:hypothetical protein [Nitrospira sp.]
MRFIVAGRREEPGTRVLPQMAPGVPPVSERTIDTYLLIQVVGEDDKPISNGQIFPVPAESLESISEYETGTIYELTKV